MYDLAVINGKAYINGAFRKTNVYILNGRIAAIDDDILLAENTYDASERLVLPGFIDPHVHFELGSKLKSVDGFENGSKCCAYGGITTFIDFLDPISTAQEVNASYKQRMKLAKKSNVDYSFHLTLKNPKNVKDIVDKIRLYNLKSIKLFTTYSDSGRRTYDPEIKELLEYSSLGDYIVMVHTEKDELIDLNDSYRVQDLPISRPSLAEYDEAVHLAKMVEETKGKCYMVHCSSGDTLEMLKKEFPSILNTAFFVESCPHYFVLDATKYEGEDGYLYTMAPPLRSIRENELLNKHIDDVYSIGTDHCSYTWADKNHEYLKDIPMGIGGVEHSFDIMFTLYGEKAIDKMTINPAITFGLYPQKGKISLGSDGDLVIYDATKQGIIELGHSNSDYSVYEGMLVNGKVETTILRGKYVMKKGEFLGGSGRFVLEK